MNEDIAERDALTARLIADGFSIAKVAERIGVSYGTALRRVNLLRHAGLIPPVDSSFREAERQQLIDLVLAKTPRKKICQIMGRSPSIISARIQLLSHEGAFDNDMESPMPRSDNDGFMEALRAAHVEGAGEKKNVPREGRAHFSPVSPYSGEGSPALLCAGN